MAVSAPRRFLPVLGRAPEDPEPRVRGEALLRLLEGGFLRLDALLARLVPAEFNPTLEAGAIANTSFIVASVSGIVLLFWYKTSVHVAYDSVAAMASAPFTAGLVRSIHRYSSDACMLFVLLHALRMGFARRFGGARWVAWVTGMFAVGLLWVIGWLGYWLVWDERARQVALGTARLLDRLPIFTDPLLRSFVTDQGINSLLFFVVFFLHMILPLAMGIALWLHITRLARSRFLTKGPLTACVLGATLLLSLLVPADLTPPARMTVVPGASVLDYWYLAPLWLSDRLSGGVLWTIVLLTGVLAFSVPWALVKGRVRPARVEEARCNECRTCFRDCPYAAITMVPRSDGSTKYEFAARVDPKLCVGCGICAGSCDSAGVGLPWFDATKERHAIDAMLRDALARGESTHILLVCAESAGRRLVVGEDGTAPELPGYRVLRVPCAGWVHALTVERALRRGAEGVVVVGCEPESCRYREGARTTLERLIFGRKPALRTEKVEASKVKVLTPPRNRPGELVAALQSLRRGGESAKTKRRAPIWFGATALAAALSSVTVGATQLGYTPPRPAEPELVVSFKHPGVAGEHCRDVPKEELEKLLPHMRRPRVCERRRASVELVVRVDGLERLREIYEPRGIWHDGTSVGVARLPVAAGLHEVELVIADGATTFQVTRRVRLEPGRTTVAVFDRHAGFQWEGPGL